jgi:hypothetical protein
VQVDVMPRERAPSIPDKICDVRDPPGFLAGQLIGDIEFDAGPLLNGAQVSKFV